MTFEHAFLEAASRTIVCKARCRALWEAAIARKDMPGNMAELGVFRGGTAMILAAAVPTKLLYAFDTFSGLPFWSQHFDGKLHAKGDFAFEDVDETIELLTSKGILIRQGIFPATVPEVDDKFCLVHVDGDSYESTKAAVEYFWPRMVAGGAMIFDDYDWFKTPGVKRYLDTTGLQVKKLVESQGIIIHE